MAFKILVTCNDGKRDYAIERLKEFQDIKNIQERKNQHELFAEVQSDDKDYVMTNVVQRIQAIEGISDVSIPPL
jgi:translation elongation factor EF-1beta